MNKAILIGNLGRDAELKYTPNGKAVATWSMATTESWKNQQGQRQEKTTWHRCVLWGKPAESLNEYLVKGKQVAVEGRIDNREYEQDGVKKYISEIIVDRLTLLGGGNGQRNGGGSRQAGNEFGGVDDFEPPMEPITDDDIAF